MTNEPLLDEIRRVRHEISAELGHDPRMIAEYYADLQRLYQGRVVNLSGESVSTQHESAPSLSRNNDNVPAAPNRG